jgi:hypothetical protein
LRKEDVIVGLVLVLLVLSVFDLLNDPYFHREKVNFWTWAKREIWEELTFERE